MEKCCDCKNKADVSIIYPRSLFFLCNKCLIIRIEKFNFFNEKPRPPVLIPIEYIRTGWYFPVVKIRYGKEYFIYGMKEKDYKKWEKSTDKLLEFNIL